MSYGPLLADEYEWLKAVARYHVGDIPDHEDLAQETACIFLANAHRYDFRNGIRPMLRTILLNLVRRRHNARKNHGCSWTFDVETRQAPDSSDSLSMLHDTLRIIRQCCRESRGTEFFMLYLQGYSYREIAEMKGTGIGTVKSGIHYGKKLLREALLNS